MDAMFYNATAFNAPLSFDTRRMRYMRHMFHNATAFNQPLNFDTRNVRVMSGMFCDAVAFNQPLNLDTRNVQVMDAMFYNATAFNAPLSFDTRNVRYMSNMFHGAVSFNRPLVSISQPLHPVNFDTRNVQVMEGMFYNATAFNPRPLFLDTRNVTNMSNMFRGAESFNRPLNFDTQNVINMSHMFDSASHFNQPLESWNTNKVQYMADMFYRAPFMTKRYPTGLRGLISWSTLQHDWLRTWDVIMRENPAKAERITRKRDEYLRLDRDAQEKDAVKSGQVQPVVACVVCWDRPRTVLFEKCKHMSLCDSEECVQPLFNNMGLIQCMSCKEPHRNDQVKSILQWCSEHLDDNDRLFVSGGGKRLTPAVFRLKSASKDT